jgi:hypothetical protein
MTFGVFGPANEHDLVIQLDSETALRCVWTMSTKVHFAVSDVTTKILMVEGSKW